MTSFGNITTGGGANPGDFSDGIIAQSVAGGGGNGGFSVAGGVAESGAVTVGLGGSAGDGGTAGFGDREQHRQHQNRRR